MLPSINASLDEKQPELLAWMSLIAFVQYSRDKAFEMKWICKKQEHMQKI